MEVGQTGVRVVAAARAGHVMILNVRVVELLVREALRKAVVW